MKRFDYVDYLNSIERIEKEIALFVPDGAVETAEFRSDLAGLLAVAIASSYENCIKETMIRHAARVHNDFEYFTEKNFSQLNSKIKVDDLKRYASLFGDHYRVRFSESLRKDKARLLEKTNFSIEACYHQILQWRHSYAHAGQRNTTIPEIVKFHRYGKRVVFCFGRAFLPLGEGVGQFTVDG